MNARILPKIGQREKAILARRGARAAGLDGPEPFGVIPGARRGASNEEQGVKADGILLTERNEYTNFFRGLLRWSVFFRTDQIAALWNCLFVYRVYII